jgi:hypothetical protein
MDAKARIAAIKLLEQTKKHPLYMNESKPSITNTLQSYHIFEIMTSIILNTVRSIRSNCAIRVILSRRIIS